MVNLTLTRIIPASDFSLEIARNRIPGVYSINKFGLNVDIDAASEEDVWDGGGTWTAPTQARTHDITSTDTNDTSAGTGARTIRIHGLKDWDTAEVSEDITMNGTSNVETVNSYVIIHRMQVLTKGASGPNVGTITATAQTDSTVTAQIGASNGQTLMAIYGIPSTQVLYMTDFYTGISRQTTSAFDATLRFNPEPDVELTGFLIRHRIGGHSQGSSHIVEDFVPYKKFEGPGILKVSAGTTTNNSEISAGFDAIIIDN